MFWLTFTVNPLLKMAVWHIIRRLNLDNNFITLYSSINLLHIFTKYKFKLELFMSVYLTYLP